MIEFPLARGQIMRFLVSVIVFAFIVWAPAHAQKGANPDVPKSVPGDRNIANKKLMSLSEADRRKFFFVILNMSHEQCGGEVTRTFYQGSAKPSWNAIWSIACSSGPSYRILVFSDENGSSKVLTCGESRAMGAGECFVHLQ